MREKLDEANGDYDVEELYSLKSGLITVIMA